MILLIVLLSPLFLLLELSLLLLFPSWLVVVAAAVAVDWPKCLKSEKSGIIDPVALRHFFPGPKYGDSPLHPRW